MKYYGITGHVTLEEVEQIALLKITVERLYGVHGKLLMMGVKYRKKIGQIGKYLEKI